MKHLLTVILSLIYINHANATEITYCSSAEGLPLSREVITEFQMTSSMQQYTEEQKTRVKPYTEKRIEQLFDQLDLMETFVAVMTESGKVSAISWLRDMGNGALNMRQTNASAPSQYLELARNHLKTYPEFSRITFKVPLERIALLSKMLGDVQPKEIEPYEDDDQDISKDLTFKYFEITSEALGL